MSTKAIILLVVCTLFTGASEGGQRQLPLSRLPEVSLKFDRISKISRPEADEKIRQELAARLVAAGVTISEESHQHLDFRVTETAVPGCPEIVHLRLEVWLWESVLLPRLNSVKYVVDTVSATEDEFVRASEVETESRSRLLFFADRHVMTELAAMREIETEKGTPTKAPAPAGSK